MPASWKDGFHARVDADVAHTELERIRKQNGGILAPQTVVDESRADEAPLHPQFEWDDWKAAEAYRRHEARTMIRSVKVIQDVPGALDVPEYVHVRVMVQPADAEQMPQHKGVYLPVADAMRDPYLRAQVLRRAKTELDTWQKKYAEYEELSVVFNAIQQVGTELEEKLAS